MTPEAFSQALEKCGIQQGARVLAAVSGGADSLCLLWLLVQIRHDYPLEVECAHAEHGLRGSASLEDLEFVRNICSAWGVPFHTEHLNVPAHRKDCGGERLQLYPDGTPQRRSGRNRPDACGEGNGYPWLIGHGCAGRRSGTSPA